jgi:hypothetical protein
MPKAISVEAPLNTAEIPKEGAEVTITAVRIVRDQWTSIGTMKLGLAMDIEYQDGEYSQLFSMDKPVLAGSIGRLLVSIGIEDTEIPNFEERLSAFVGKKVKVMLKGEKIYWYP